MIVGTPFPFGILGTHFSIWVSQNSALEQSPSARHPPTGSHAPVTEQNSERHTVIPSPVVQGPSPGAYPHFPSLSQTPLMQTVVAFIVVQGPSPFA
jgi:hypothetical protein